MASYSRRAPSPLGGPPRANLATLRLSVATIFSAVAAPMPGSVVSHFGSWREMASAIDLVLVDEALNDPLLPAVLAEKEAKPEPSWSSANVDRYFAELAAEAQASLAEDSVLGQTTLPAGRPRAQSPPPPSR